MKESNDGFEISRFDLSLRGPGELVGQKQSGLPPLQFSNFIDDIKILDIAQKDAYDIIKDINNEDYQKIINKALLDLKKDYEDKNVIVVTPSTHTYMLNSNLLYVAYTRAKERCFNIGNPKTVAIAVRKKQNLSRETFLQDIIKKLRSVGNESNINENN